MVTFLRKQSLEIYIGAFFLLIFCVLALVQGSSSVGKLFAEVTIDNILQSIVVILNIIGNFYFYVIAFLIVAAEISIFLKYLVYQDGKKATIYTLETIKNIVLFSGGVTALTGLFVFSAKLISYQEAQRVIDASVTLLRFDLMLFGVHPPIALQSLQLLPGVDNLLVTTYTSLGFIFSGVMVLLVAINTKLFRFLFFAFLIAPVISLPFWYSVPAVSFDEMFRENILRIEEYNVPQEEIIHSFTRAPRVEEYTDGLIENQIWSSPDEGYFAVTTFPSMHVAWGIILVFAMWRLWKWTAVIAIPWMLLNTISTVYTLQHYAVDVFLGALMAVVAIYISLKLLDLESRYIHFDKTYSANVYRGIQKIFSSLVSSVRDLIRQFKGN